MKAYCVIVDLDGTLADCDHRRHHLVKSDWTAFFEAMDADLPHPWCSHLYNALHARQYEMVILTARPEKYRARVTAWLEKFGFQWAHLYMRKNGDYRKDAIIKSEIYEKFIEPYFTVLFALDDRAQVVDMWRAKGIVTLQCAPGQF